MNIKINKKLMTLLLANTLCLTTVGCNNSNNRFESKIAITYLNENNKDVADSKILSDLEENNDTNNNKPNNVIHKKSVIAKKVNNNACLLSKGKLRKINKKKSKVIKEIDINQKVKEIGITKNGWSLVKYNGTKGFIKSNKIKNIGDTYIEIDISDQKLKYFKDNKKVLSTDVVTGKDSTPTKEGLFDIYQKCTDVTMIGRNNSYTSYSEYVLKFFEAYYIHDASWRSEFGGEIYKNNGSHGCVNTPYKKVKKLYNSVDLHTPVLIHK